MKLLLPLLLLLFAISFEVLSQSKKIGDQEFSFASGEWLKINRDGKSYKIDSDVITIKFRTNEVEKFMNKYGLSIARKSLNGYYDIRVSNNSPILEKLWSKSKESHIQD